ncbi:uncharacterized protein LOC104556965 [Colius striatus]|uniref:uncharacterized protein LOC104556965 n=1 Tax=Colius striatus TaxID=57412 RepID=UPI002B1DF7E2|nr:uncharacterized protein LOC104556965 [Colius striatus]
MSGTVGVSDERSSLRTDLLNLVTWAHSHGAMCNKTPTLEPGQNVCYPSRDNCFVWICEAGHAYLWQCERLWAISREEDEAVEARRRFMSASEEGNLHEKRFRLIPSFERAEADVVSTGAGSRGATQHKDHMADIVFHDEPSPRENKNHSKCMKSSPAAEQHWPATGEHVREFTLEVKHEMDKEPQIISDEHGTSDEDKERDRMCQNILSESPVRDAAAKVDLQMHCGQKTVFKELRDTPGKTSLTLPCHCPTPTPSVSSQDSLDSRSLQLGPLKPAGSVTPRERNSSGSPIPEEHLQSVPISITEGKVSAESPTSALFFVLEVTDQQQFQLSSPNYGSLESSLSENIAESPVEEDELSTSGCLPHLSASLNSEDGSTDHLPTTSKKAVLEKERKRRADKTNSVKIFKDWMASHCPSETRELHQLPPEALNSYLVTFFSSGKRRDNKDFAASSLNFIQSKMDIYLRDHNYGYSVVKGLEFRESQKALKLKKQQLFQKEREKKLRVLENLTDEEVERLHSKGLLRMNHPESLLQHVFLTLIRGFGANTHSQNHNLSWGQLVLRKDEGELEYLEWRSDEGAEGDSRQGGRCLLARPDAPDRCPVAAYKEFASRRPPDALHGHDPLYLALRPQWSTWDQVWYCRKALSKIKQEKMLKLLSKQVKDPVREPKK